MCCVFSTPLAVFLELDFSLDFAFVFPRPVVEAFAIRALKFYEIWLRHRSTNNECITNKRIAAEAREESRTLF